MDRSPGAELFQILGNPPDPTTLDPRPPTLEPWDPPTDPQHTDHPTPAIKKKRETSAYLWSHWKSTGILAERCAVCGQCSARAPAARDRGARPRPVMSGRAQPLPRGGVAMNWLAQAGVEKTKKNLDAERRKACAAAERRLAEAATSQSGPFWESLFESPKKELAKQGPRVASR